MAKRRTVVDDLRALNGGGIEALRVAERLARADGQLQIRVSTTRKRLYTEAAKREGLTLSAWVVAQLDAALGR